MYHVMAFHSLRLASALALKSHLFSRSSLSALPLPSCRLYLSISLSFWLYLYKHYFHFSTQPYLSTYKKARGVWNCVSGLWNMVRPGSAMTSLGAYRKKSVSIILQTVVPTALLSPFLLCTLSAEWSGVWKISNDSGMKGFGGGSDMAAGADASPLSSALQRLRHASGIGSDE